MLQITINLNSVPTDARAFLVHATFTRIKACTCTYGNNPTVSFMVEDFTIALSVWWRFFCAMSRSKIGQIENLGQCMRLHYRMKVKSLVTGREQNIMVYLSANYDGINYGLED